MSQNFDVLKAGGRLSREEMILTIALLAGV